MVLKPNSFNKKLDVIICADDFGMSCGINSAIIKLLEAKRISAVSCLVAGKAWNEGYGFLKKFQNDIDIGLHLSFTHTYHLTHMNVLGVSDKLPAFKKIVELAYLKRINKKIILNEFRIQLENFYKKMGRYPDFIDGHKYIHQLPIFRVAMTELISSIEIDKIYIRNSSISILDILARKTAIFKNFFISMQGYSLKKYLFKKCLYTNNDLLGIYNFNRTIDFQSFFGTTIKTIKTHNSIFVVHPSHEDKEYGCEDNISNSWREREMEYLSSNSHKNLMNRLGMRLTRFVF